MKAVIGFDGILGVGATAEDARADAYDVVRCDIDLIRMVLDNSGIFSDTKWKHYGELEGSISDMECVEMSSRLAAAVEDKGYDTPFKHLPSGVICTAEEFEAMAA